MGLLLKLKYARGTQNLKGLHGADHRVHILLSEGNPISLVFQNIDPPSPSPPGECVPLAFVAGGGQTRKGERGMGGQYFGRREK
jgi:hypothetical protein